MEADLLRLLTTVGLAGSDQKKESIHDAILRDTFSQISANITDPVIANALHNLETYLTMSEKHTYSDATIQRMYPPFFFFRETPFMTRTISQIFAFDWLRSFDKSAIHLYLGLRLIGTRNRSYQLL